MVRRRSPIIRHGKKRAFLAAYSQHGNIKDAAAAATIDRTTHYDWLEKDERYVRAFEDAKANFADRIEAEAIRRAVEGVPRMRFHKGCPIQMPDGKFYIERQYSDGLLKHILTAFLPERYGVAAQQDAIGPEPEIIQREALWQAGLMEATMRGLAPPSGMLPDAWSTFRIVDVQLDLLEDTSRFVALPCGRGSGKTEIAKRRLVSRLPQAVPEPPGRYFYAAPTLKHCRALAWDSLLRLIPPSWIKAPNESKNRIETHWGARIVLIGFDDRRRSEVEGKQWDFGIVDESSDIWPGVYQRQVRPALAIRKGGCWRIGVPKRQGVGAAEFKEWSQEAASGEHEDQACHTWPSAKVVPAEEVEAMRRSMDIKDFREQAEASWETAGGAIFHAYDPVANVRRCEYHADMPLIIGSDFNVDPMAWVIGHAYPLENISKWMRRWFGYTTNDPPAFGRLEWIDEIWLRDTNTRKTLDVLWAKYQHHTGGFLFMGDPAARSRETSASFSDYQQIFNDKRFTPIKPFLDHEKVCYARAHPEVRNRFAWCNARFCNAMGERAMFVDPSCKHLKTDLEARYYREGTVEPVDKGDLGHITDAMGYVVALLMPIKTPLDYGVPEVIIKA